MKKGRPEIGEVRARRRVTVTLKPELKRSLDIEARALGISTAKLVRRIIKGRSGAMGTRYE